jgi:protein-L-isoaspartate(D-aspartate) O-methyltransferase
MVQSEVIGRGIRSPRVVRAVAEVPRHLFVPQSQRKFAYHDAALPLGHGQTITSPFVVAFMTEQLDPQPTDRVLEIGTGSGYQAAVLSRIVAEVYSIEIVAPLARRAAKTLESLGYTNVHTKTGDGYAGWPEQAPFDKIIVTCSPESVPPALVQQLKEGGRLIVPLGQRYQQSLYLFRKIDGELEKQKLEATFFVPMTGQAEALRQKSEDSSVPKLVNGGFEQVGEDGEPVGWFYVRQANVLQDPNAPQGDHVLELSNRVAGQNSHAIQAFGVDGRVVRRLELSVDVQTQSVSGWRRRGALPRLVLSFYNENRASIDQQGLGPWQGDPRWSHYRVTIPVPRETRLATVALGMFGATGRVRIDRLNIRAVPQEQPSGN